MEIIQRSAEFLERSGVESPRLQSELMLAQILGMPRLRLYLNFDRALSESEVGAMRVWVKRRSSREPLQFILGTASFCGFEIAVTRDVLIPRPETEILAEMTWSHLKALPHEPAPSVLDFGTGSGCIAIAVAHHCPSARVVGLDVSPAALSVARDNAARHALQSRIEFVLGDGLQSAAAGAPRFDTIVANPPYIPTGDLDQLQPEVARFEPSLALDGGPDGLKFFRSLATVGRSVLRPGGVLFAEFSEGQGRALHRLFDDEKWVVHPLVRDYTGRERFIKAASNPSV